MYCNRTARGIDCPLEKAVKEEVGWRREEIKSLDKGICQRCLIKFGIITIENLEVHHIEPLTTKWEKRLQNDNLITLCLQCHRWIDIKNNGRLDFEWNRVEEEYTFEFR